MFYYNFDNDKCVGIICVDDLKIKDDSFMSLARSKEFIPLESVVKNNIESKGMKDKREITLTTTKDTILSDGVDFALIKIIGLDYSETNAWIEINGEKIQISKAGNGEMVFKLKSNLRKTYHIKSLTEGCKANIINIFSV